MSDKISFDSKTEKHAGTEIGSLADLGLGLIDSAIAKPYNATIGLIAPKIDLSDEYNHQSIAAKVGDFGGGPIPVQPEFQAAQGSLDLGEIWLGTDRTRGGFACFGPEHPWRRIPIDRAGGVAVGTSGPGESVIWVKVGGVSEIFDCLFRGRWAELLPEVTPVQVEVVGFSVLCLPAAQSAKTFRRQCEAYLLGDGFAKLTLQREHAVGLAIVGRGP